MKNARLFLFIGLVTSMSLFVSCGKDGNYPKNFPEGCPNFTDHAYAGDLLDAMAPGIYEFYTAENWGEISVLAKSSDGWVFWLPKVDYIAPEHSNFIGNVCYLGFYAVDNDKSCYSLYGETTNQGKAQYYDQREFLDRKAMIKGITTPAGLSDERFNFAINTADGILDYLMALGHVAYHYDTFLDEWGETYDTTICNIPVTCYYHERHRYFVDKNWMCLYHIFYGQYNDVTDHVVHELIAFTEAGDHEQTYAKIFEKYGNSIPKPEWSNCIRSYRKQANEWLTDEYPRTLDTWFKVYHGTGTIHDMSISRRIKWSPQFDLVCTITVRIEGVSYVDGLQYMGEAASVCDNIVYNELDESQGTIHFEGSLENVDISGVSFGDSYFHPGYEITLNKEGTLVIVFDVIKTFIV